VQAAGNTNYNINISAQIPGSSAVTMSVNPSLSVH
jgi:hypothetical protein